MALAGGQRSRCVRTDGIPLFHLFFLSFLVWTRLDEKGSRGSLSSSIKGPVESDNDSMEEYGEAAEAGEDFF